MPKSQKVSKKSIGMPKAPWIYVNDPTPGACHALELAAMIEGALCIRFWERPADYTLDGKRSVILLAKQPHCATTESLTALKEVRAMARSRAANFVTVNITTGSEKAPAHDELRGNHLEVVAAKDVAQTIHKWLFTVLTIRETLYLISQAEMKKADTKFPNYAYCPISQVDSIPKNAKIQLVCLILDKPQIKDGNRLTWSVADRTGVAKFYFQWRDSSSQHTWDFVLNLKAGQRAALPRMPMVEFREKKRVRLVKAPLRATAAVFAGTGLAIRAVGNGLCKVGKAVSMGKSSEWVSEADVGPDGKKIDWSKVGQAVDAKKPSSSKITEMCNEKSEKTWGDDASVASTDVGSVVDEKAEKEFS
ncbi:hypothetical protein LTR51_005700 [Lithohypha guttulata]|nr:hypothetical protein LTR51_005700 [Lithohypha guttulata]